MLKRLAHLLLIAALAVVGIAMSSHSATPAGHSMPASNAANATAPEIAHEHPASFSAAADSDAADSDAPALPGTPCTECANDHSALLMACAFLAFLLVVSFFLPALALRFGVLAPGVSLIADTPRRIATPRPPDLTELCISRQ